MQTRHCSGRSAGGACTAGGAAPAWGESETDVPFGAPSSEMLAMSRVDGGGRRFGPRAQLQSALTARPVMDSSTAAAAASITVVFWS